MGILQDLDFNNLPESEALAGGEYEVAIIEAGEYVGKSSGKTSIRMVLDIPGEVAADTIYHYLSLPTSEDDEKTRIRKTRRIKQCLDAFGITPEEDYSDWAGKTAWALIGLENDQNDEARNTVKRFIAQR